MCVSESEDQFRIDPDKLPKQLDIDLPSDVAEQLEKTAVATGRSVEELILEILDQYLHPE
jgi:plasmid stability protein